MNRKIAAEYVIGIVLMVVNYKVGNIFISGFGVGVLFMAMLDDFFMVVRRG